MDCLAAERLKVTADAGRQPLPIAVEDRRPGSRESGPPIDRWGFLILPGLVVLVVFFLLPLAWMTVRSLTDPNPGNFLIFFRSSIYARILANTVFVAAITTAVCAGLGYPYAYAMHRSGPRLTAVLTALVILPFWSSVLVRAYAWVILLRDSGVVNTFLIQIHVLRSPLPIIQTNVAMIIAMVHIMLPFMVLPLYAAMSRIDPDLLPAAAALGSRPLRSLRLVFLPLTLPGLYAGGLLVFVVSLGFYIVPALLGGNGNAMFSQVIVEKVNDELAFGVGAALAITLLMVTLVVLLIGGRFMKIRDAVQVAAR